MWPLYDDVEDEKAGEEQAEMAAKQWAGCVERGYFEAFRHDWKRIHYDAMRLIPIVDDKESVRWKAAKVKIEESAREMRNRVETTQTTILESDIGRVPSVWELYDNFRLSECVDDKNPVEDTVSLRSAPSFARIHRIDRVVLVDRLDREDVRCALMRLQEDGADLVNRMTVHAVDPPQCPFLNLEMLGCLGQQDTEERSTNNAADEDNVLVRPPRPLACVVRMVDVPCRRRTTGRETAWSKLQAQAQRVLSTVINGSADVISRIEIDSKPDLVVFKPLLKGAPADVLEKSVDPPHKAGASARPADIVRQIACSFDPVCPRYAKFDGLFQARPQKSLPKFALSTLKGIVKKNASLLLVSATPNTLASDIGDILRRANRANTSLELIHGNTRDRLRLVPLASEVVMHDEARIDHAGVTIGPLARDMLKTIPPPPISLTNVALMIPSLWRVSGVLAHVDAHRTSDFFTFPVVDVQEKTIPHPDEEEGKYELVPDEDPQLPVPATKKFDASGVMAEKKPSTTTPIAVLVETQLLPPRKQVTFKVQESVSTDELVMSFLGHEPSQGNAAPPLTKTPSNPPDASAAVVSTDTSFFALAIDQLARPAVWFLVRVKLLKVKPMAMIEALKAIPLEVLASVVFQLQSKLRGMVSHAAKLPLEDILETCLAFRHAVWLHSLRMLVEFDEGTSCSQLLITSRIVTSPTYQSALAKAQIKSLSNLYISMGGLPIIKPQDDTDCKPNDEPPLKKTRASLVQEESTPVRLICAMHLLERDELLEELSELDVSVIERELPSSIDIIVDEHNAIVLLTDQHFTEEKLMKVLTYELASVQVQFRKLWVLLRANENEEALHLFFAALTNFKIDVQTFSCRDDAEASQIIRGIVDACAESALSRHRVLPRMWFARPFMLEEESQLELFLTSTRIMNAFAAQSVLHRLSFEELTSKSMEELKAMIGASLTTEQLTLLWRMLHNRHGIDDGETMRS